MESQMFYRGLVASTCSQDWEMVLSPRTHNVVLVYPFAIALSKVIFGKELSIGRTKSPFKGQVTCLQSAISTWASGHVD